MSLPTTGDPNRKKAMRDAQERMKQRRAAGPAQEAPIRDDASAARRESESKPKKRKR
jgi:hypothetical protein